jgi:hypothetical protein
MKSQSIHTAFRLIALVAADSIAQPLLADSLISNTDRPIYGLMPIVYARQWVATPFRTGANPAQVDSLSLYESTSQTPGAGSFWVSIYSDNKSLPGSALPGGILNGPAMPQGDGYQTYAAIQSLTLAPNTLYWVVAASDAPLNYEAYNWGAAADTSYTSAAGWSYFGNYYAQTSDKGATWSIQSWYQTDGGPQLLAINGTIVPEPSTLAFAGLGAAAICFRWKRNRSGVPGSTNSPYFF